MTDKWCCYQTNATIVAAEWWNTRMAQWRSKDIIYGTNIWWGAQASPSLPLDPFLPLCSVSHRSLYTQSHSKIGVLSHTKWPKLPKLYWSYNGSTNHCLVFEKIAFFCILAHSPIASWIPLVESSEASHIPAVRSGLPLVVPSTRRSTLGDRAFPVTSARAWDSLPSSVRNAPSLTTFRRELNWRLYFSGRRLTMIRRSWLYCTV